MKKYNTFAFILIFIIPMNLFSQEVEEIGENCLEKYLLHNKYDSLIIAKDTLAAMAVFHQMEATGCYLENWLHRNISEMYFANSDIEKAKIELGRAVEKGYLNNLIVYEEEKEYLDEWEEKYGKAFTNQLVDISLNLQRRLTKQELELIYQFTEILAIDQGLRKNKLLRRITSIGYGIEYFGNISDSLIDSRVANIMYKKWWAADSINLQKFVDICLDIGTIPDYRITRGMVTTFVLVIHSAKFDFPESYQALVKKALKTNHFSPHYYGWYLGYKNEYANKSHELYYTVSKEELEAMPPEEIEVINMRRAEIGLKLCPSTVWNPNLKE